MFANTANSLLRTTSLRLDDALLHMPRMHCSIIHHETWHDS